MAQNNGASSAREQARKLQQEQERKQKMQSMGLRIGVVALAVIVAAAITLYVVFRGPAADHSDGPAPSVANEQGGITLTSASEMADGDDLGDVDAENIDDVETSGGGEQPPGVEPREEGEPPHAVIYTDAGCPACGQFEAAYHQVLEEWVDSGVLTVEYRGVNWVDPPYSTQTANAFACMADESPENFMSYHGQVTSVRAEDGELDNDELADVAETDYGADISECVEDGTYQAFVQYTSEVAGENGISATPTIFVNDQEVEEYMSAPEEIQSEIEAYQEEAGIDDDEIDVEGVEGMEEDLDAEAEGGAEEE